MNRYVIDTVYPISSDGVESFIIYDNYQGKYVSNHYFDYDLAEEDLYLLDMGEEIENAREFG